MQENRELELDQLWYTWSASGLGHMPKGFRVRGASEGLHDTQGLPYRRVSRLLNYELPQGVSREFDPNIAPVSLTFIYNGKEKEPLLIRKVYTGLDAVGHNGAFFTHLIAGLPREFTARDAIRLWYCPKLWVEPDSGKHPQDTSLEKIRYSDIRSYVKLSETSFNLAPVSEQLRDLLLFILVQGLPQSILMRGHSTLIASLIYGLTHALPRSLLPDLSFTTYESQPQASETLITGTINWAELRDVTRIQVQPGLASEPVPADLQRYATTAVDALLTGDTTKLSKVINDIEQRDHASVEDLLLLFNRRFRTGQLPPNLLDDILSHPAENMNDLTDPGFQKEAAQLLLNQPDYWKDRGRKRMQLTVDWLLPEAQAPLDQQAREALLICIKSMIEHVRDIIRSELLQGIIPTHGMAVLGVLSHPSLNHDIYLRILTKWAHGSIYKRITSDQLWGFHLWLLWCAKVMQPQPTWEHILPWLYIPSWDRLADVLKLDLPVKWERQAIYELLNANRELPKTAYLLVKMYEARFSRAMQAMLLAGNQIGNRDHTDAALRLFAAVIRYDEQDHSYPNRAGLLLDLLNAVPNDSAVIEALVALVPFASPYQLTMQEFDRVVAGCRPEVLATGGASPSLVKYLQEYILVLTPKKLNANTIKLLKQFQHAAATLPEGTAKLVNSWLDINTFLSKKAFEDEKLLQIEPALASLVPLLQQRGQDTWQTFIQELAPYLTTLIETEYQLQTVLDVFEGARVVAAWDLLNVLADREGALHVENLELYRLFPYVIVGIREYIRSGQSQNELDKYLQTLFAQVSGNMLVDVDKAISARVWTEPIQVEWKGWRERSKPSLSERVKWFSIQQQLSSTEQQPNQPFQEQHPRRSVETKVLPAMLFQRPTGPHSDQAKTEQRPMPAPLWPGLPDMSQMMKQTDDQVKALMGDILTASQYQRLCQAFILILPYWCDWLKKEWYKSPLKPLKYEMRMMQHLLTELQVPAESEKLIPEKFVQYLVDDLIIKREIIRIRQEKKQNADYILNLDNDVATQLSNVRGFVGSKIYDNFRANSGEEAIKPALYSLICRYHLLRYMEEYEEGGFDYWIKEQRKQAKTQQ